MLCIYGGECEGCMDCCDDCIGDERVCGWCEDDIVDYFYEINGVAVCGACMQGRVVYCGGV